VRQWQEHSSSNSRDSTSRHQLQGPTTCTAAEAKVMLLLLLHQPLLRHAAGCAWCYAEGGRLLSLLPPVASTSQQQQQFVLDCGGQGDAHGGWQKDEGLGVSSNIRVMDTFASVYCTWIVAVVSRDCCQLAQHLQSSPSARARPRVSAIMC
jgi:hypothetical protein